MNLPNTKDLVYEILALRKEVDRLRGVERCYKGLLAELHVNKLLPGSKLTSWVHQDGDIIDMNMGNVEVKFASNSSQTAGYKWDWNNIFGMNGNKKFDYLILIGSYEGKYKYFALKRNEIHKEIIGSFKANSVRISIRYSEKDWSKYQKYLAPFEAKAVELKKL